MTVILATVLALSTPIAAFADAGPPDAATAPVTSEGADVTPAPDQPAEAPKAETKAPDPMELGSSVYSKLRSGEYLGALIPGLVLVVFLLRLIPSKRLNSRLGGYILAQLASFGTYLLTWQLSGEPWTWTMIPMALFAALAAGGGYDAFREKFGIGA